MTVGSSLVAICESLKQLKTPGDFFQSISKFTESMEMESFLYTTVPEYFTHNAESPPPVVATNFDPAWMDFYIYKRMDLDDAGFAYCVNDKNVEPFLWSQKAGSFSSKEKRVHALSKEAVGELVTIPIQNNIGAISIVSFSRRSNPDQFFKTFNNARSDLMQYIYAFNDAILSESAVHFGNPFSPGLTLAEKDILKYLANGYSRKEISRKKIKAQGTIDKQINSAMSKLRARNTVHAVVLALKWNLLE